MFHPKTNTITRLKNGKRTMCFLIFLFVMCKIGFFLFLNKSNICLILKLNTLIYNVDISKTFFNYFFLKIKII